MINRRMDQIVSNSLHNDFFLQIEHEHTKGAYL